MIKKIKYLLILLFVLSFINISFADGFSSGSINNCLETRCINERIDELIKVNKILQIENKELSDKYNGFNSSLDYYVKILSKGGDIANEKKEAYDIALNNIQYWIWIIGFILGLILIGFGVDYKKSLSEQKQSIEKSYKDKFDFYMKEIENIREKIKEDLEPKIKEDLSSQLSAILDDNSGKKLDDLISPEIISKIVEEISGKEKFENYVKIKVEEKVEDNSSISFSGIESRLSNIEDSLGFNQ